MMRKVLIAKSFCFLALAAIGLSLVGCAEDVGTIDRTRSDKVKKSIFQNDDEWWYRETVVETDQHNSFNEFGGASQVSPLKRIRWEITEDALIAYSTVEPQVNSEQDIQDPKTRRGGVVAAFPITSHFDIQRSYNTSTGQVSNVVIEDTSERQWQDREYMRVAWERNAIDSVGAFGSMAAKYSSLVRSVSEIEQRFDYFRPTVTDTYIDSVSQYFIEANGRACYGLNGGRTGIQNCESGVASVRHSFLKLPKKQTFQPLNYKAIDYLADANGEMVKSFRTYAQDINSTVMLSCDPSIVSDVKKSRNQAVEDACKPLVYPYDDRFGYFREARFVHDPTRINYEEQQLSMANRWNVWQTAYNDDGSIIPLNERKPKQIVYYTNAGYPEEHWNIAERVTSEWNKVFTDVVKNARHVNTCNAQGIQAFYEQYIEIRDRVLSYYIDASGADPSTSALRVSNDEVLTDLMTLAFEELPEREALDTNYQFAKGQAPLGLKSICNVLSSNYQAKTSVPTVTNSLKDPNIQTLWQSLGAPPSTAANNCTVDDVRTWLEGYFETKEDVWALVAAQEAANAVTPFSLAGKLLPNETWYNSRDLIQDLVNELAQARLREFEKSDSGKDAIGQKCSDVKERVKNSAVVVETTSITNDIYLKEIKSLWNRLNITFDDANLTAIKKLIADNNNGDDHMYIIRRNSCSAIEIEKWFSERQGLNEEAEAIRKRLSENGSIRDAIAALPVKELKRTCAEIEYATAVEEDEKNRFTWQKLGDLRYSFFNVQTEESFGWSGFGPSSADPITGEIISAAANYAGQYIRYVTPIIADLILYYQGRLPDSQYMWGEYLFKYLNQQSKLASQVENEKSDFLNLSDAKSEFKMPIPGVNPESIIAGRPSKTDVYKKVPEKILELGVRKLTQLEQVAMEKNFAALERKSKKFAEIMALPEAQEILSQSDEYVTALNQFKDELRATNPNLSEEEVEKVAFRQMMQPEYEARRASARSRRASSRNMMLNEDLDTMLSSVIGYIGATEYLRGKTKDEVADFIFDTIIYGTQLHEVGHTLGLRHNFSASADAVNYDKEYWDMMAIVKRDAEIIKANNLTPEEIKANGLITEDDLWYMPKERAEQLLGYEISLPFYDQSIYRCSSVMDYIAGVFARGAGLGRYDNAAIQFAYANKIETLPASAKITEDLDFYTNYYLNYRDLPALYIGIQGENATNISAAEYQIGVKNMTRNRVWVDVDDSKKDYVTSIYKNAEAYHKGGEFFKLQTMQLDRSVPYKYCDDYYARRGSFMCNLMDWGATMGEVLNLQFDTWRANRNWWRYTKGKANGYNTLNGFIGRLQNILVGAQQPFFFYSIYGYLNLGSFTADLKRAAINSFNFMNEIYAQPEPGPYCLVQRRSDYRGNSYFGYYDTLNSYVPARFYTDGPKVGCQNPLYIGKDVGAFINNEFNSSLYDNQLNRVGAFFDKMISLQFFYNIVGDYARIEQINDSRAGRASFWTAFKDQVYDWTRGVILNDYKSVGGVINTYGFYEPPLSIDPLTFETGKVNRQAVLPRVATQSTYDMSFRAIVYSILVNNTYQDYTPDFIQYMKVCSSPSECQMSEDNWNNGFDGVPPIIFKHPYLPMEFRAFTPKDGKSIAKDLIDRLNEIKPIWIDAKKDLDAAAPGSGNYKKSLETLQNAESAMESYISKVNQIRFVMKATNSYY